MDVSVLKDLTFDRAGYIWMPSPKGGLTVVAQIRGWGFLTGSGHGALGLPEDEARKIQDGWCQQIIDALNVKVIDLPPAPRVPETIITWTLAGLNFFEENNIDLPGRALAFPGTLKALRAWFVEQYGVYLPDFAFKITEELVE